MNTYRDIFQTVWGIALFTMGVGVFFRVPYVMERIAGFEHFTSVSAYIRICFYIMGILLIGGGVKKLYGLWYSEKRVDNAGKE
ncbi:MAG: hypothetical protein KGY61_02070 [Desulfobacterales bacterium]|nr:hypothetical protein [Desulfobacterales bacterium]